MKGNGQRAVGGLREVVAVAVVTGFCLFASFPVLAQTTQGSTHKKTDERASQSDEKKIESRLQKVLANQKHIAEKLDVVTEELRIVKVRVSR